MTTLEDYIRQIVPNPVFSDYMTFASVPDPAAFTQTVAIDFTERGAKLIIIRSIVLYNINSGALDVTLTENFNNILLSYNSVNGSTMNGMYPFNYIMRSRILKLTLSFVGPAPKLAGSFTAQVQYVYDQESKVLKQ